MAVTRGVPSFKRASRQAPHLEVVISLQLDQLVRVEFLAWGQVLEGYGLQGDKHRNVSDMPPKPSSNGAAGSYAYSKLTDSHNTHCSFQHHN